MEWTKEFYTRQYELLGSAVAWSRFSPDNLPEPRKRRAAAVERIAGPGRKRVLELGCGGGITAGAIAALGNQVVAVDLVDEAVASAKQLAARISTQIANGEMTVVQGDFYELELAGLFDVVCYFDGFGIGADADQRLLLRRIAGWLNPEGCALIDVYFPGCPAQPRGEATQDDAFSGKFMERSDFDPDGCRFLHSIWPVSADEAQAVTQSLRCYSPADFRLLLEGTGLAMQTYEPYASAFLFEKPVPLKQAEIYLTKLVPADQ